MECTWGFYYMQYSQSCVGLVFTLFDPPSRVVTVKRKWVGQWMTALQYVVAFA